ncbi:MAG: hypothetical protein COT88_02320 [Candidatus Colwellbacteria bacterium CG10_big_fil_rev_8_21_14_0_10_41_28]|uniref:Sodium/calcium exchanger membrane region domain-containing protein n=1 Tax=Candidatus Colwellbacteria bacterium CG10_big_fil_rev_8_21_14_0_10_41_28 TaxID=1974539 RepID=A0A2H0VGT8_9BACT|nr:MAG: hypothetical protein COT88_02320 [Candidatus Colwellbacteria bacterium CG10_big_fil_rev_8_21_14_0_10_41_28]
MSLALDISLLILLFAALAIVSNLVVERVKYIASILRVRLFVFGILLGFVTTLPELALGISTIMDDVPSISLGNLIGGPIVMIGLILGSSLFFGRKIGTDGSLKTLLPIALVVFLPILLGLDSRYSLLDGALMIFSYAALLAYLYKANHFDHHPQIKIPKKNRIASSIFISIIGTVGIIVFSNWIVEITLDFLEYVTLGRLAIGLMVFSIGTNLPEISISLISWRKKSSELSLSHLLSSAFTNTLVLGILASTSPIVFVISKTYWVTGFFLMLILGLLLYFYHSEKKMDRREGGVLLLTYVLFMSVVIYLSISV